MVFEYAQYYNGCFLEPLSVFAFLLVGTIWSLIVLVRFVAKNHAMPALTFEKTLSMIIIILIVAFFVIMDGGRLANGGIYLWSEKSSDVVHTSGTIESIELMTRYQFGELESQYKTNEFNGVCITVNGTEFKAIAKGTLEVGDHVFIEYLPKSKYVLQIQEIM